MMGNILSTVAAKFAFFPPEPPTYEVPNDGSKLHMTGVPQDENVDVRLVDTRSETRSWLFIYVIPLLVSLYCIPMATLLI
jgi:hypothetical protein